MSIETIDADEARPSEMLGSAIQRREDPALLSGDAEYTDDLGHPGMVHLALARSQYGHAEIESIDTSAAEALDGVLGVYTHDDLQESGVAASMPVDDPSGGVSPEYPLLARGRVRYQGQAVAAVVAADRYAASEAADLIDVNYDRLDAVTDPLDAIEEGAPTVHDEAPDNVAFEWENGNAAAVEAAFAEADRTVDFDLANNRVAPTAMEPRAALARYRPSTGKLSMEMSTQNPHSVRDDLASVLGVPDHKIRVRPPDVGGGFGAKLQPYSGHLLAAWAAIHHERPVKWQATRGEDFLSMVHARQHESRVEAALSDAGDLLGIRLHTYANVGGYLTTGGSGVPKNFGQMFTGQYDVPAAHATVTGVFTNTAPLAAYRGAGRPEATYMAERLARIAARELDLDPAEFRRRNFIAPDAFPYETPIDHTYDSGEYEKALDTALAVVDYEALRERQREAREKGRYLGIGLSCYVEACGAAPGKMESGLVRVTRSGKVVVATGTAEIGTGHQTGYAQIVAERLGVDYDDVEVVEGDTDRVPEGGGTAGSRAMAVGGSAIFESAGKVAEQARRVAAHHLEAAPEDLELADGAFHVAGAPGRSISLAEVAAEAYDGDVPDGAEAGLEATSFYDPPEYTFPFGTHVAVVEVDPESGEIEFERYAAVDDVGEQINPKIVEGQIHGGVVQGIGQAIYEHARYDDNGNLVTGSMQDYALPKAMHVPEIETHTTVTPCPHNPLGVKGVGEAGAIAAPPAVVNAVHDALEPLGIDHIDMPLTSERVRRAVEDAVESEDAGGRQSFYPDG